MAFRDGSLQDVRASLIWTAAGSTIVALVIGFILLVADKRDHIGPQGYGAARNEFDELIEPVSGLLAAPMRWLADGSTEVRGYFFAVDENRRLRTKVKELERWRDAAVALKTVNERYEELLKLRTEPSIPTVAARVVADARGPFSNARLADSGSDKGVKVGQPVLSEHGVLGRIVGVTTGASRVLLLNDVDSRTPVMVDRTNSRAILTGDGGPNPRLEYLRGPSPAREGDILLTSGDGGVYPRGLPVGVLAKDLRGGWRARLYADSQAIDYVQILQYQDYAQLADLAALEAKAPPPLDPAQQAQLRATLAARTAAPAAAPNSTAASANLAQTPTSPTPVSTAATSVIPAPHPRAARDPDTAADEAKPKPKPTKPKPSAARRDDGRTVLIALPPPTGAARSTRVKPKVVRRPRGADTMAPIPDPQP